ncbi:MAG: S41 family peptidase [Chitinophagales bacterium]
MHRELSMRYLLYIFLFLFIRPAFAQVNTLSVDQQKEDLHFLRKHLEEEHPNLYLYSPKETIDSIFSDLEKSITGPCSSGQFYYRICILEKYIRDGHTLFLPEQTNAESGLFPFTLGLCNGTLLIKDPDTAHKTLSGASIFSINGIPADSILQIMRDRLPRDGNNPAYPDWIIGQYVRSFYGFFFGYPDTFRLTCFLFDSYSTCDISLPAFSYATAGTDTSSEENPETAKGIYLDNYPFAYWTTLVIKDFHKEVIHKKYHQHFRREIRHAFAEITTDSTDILCIDLRDNQGGNLSYGKYLLRYLMDSSFTTVESFYKIKDGQLNQVRHAGGKKVKPRKDAFRGTVYVLINGGSFSNSVIITSCLYRNGRATILGTESGGNPDILAGNVKTYYLPNSHIPVEVPQTRFVLHKTESYSGKGLIPDINIDWPCFTFPFPEVPLIIQKTY